MVSSSLFFLLKSYYNIVSKDSEIMDKQRREKRVLNISFWTGVLFVIAEFIMAMYSHSQSVLTDTVFDAIELVVIALTIFIVPLFYKPVSEKHPFGFAQLESIFILLKGFMFIAVMISLITNNIQIMLNGGNQVDHMQISIFEIVLTMFSSLILFYLMKLNKKVSSPTVDTEIYGWKIDVMGSVGVSIAFFISTFMVNTPLAFITPYFDQIVAIVLAVVMLPEPIRMIVEAFKSIVLFSPDDEMIEDIKEKTGKVLENYQYNPVFYDITTTGRRIWISIYFTTEHDTMSFTELELANREMLNSLKSEYDDCFVELIPNVLANKK